VSLVKVGGKTSFKVSSFVREGSTNSKRVCSKVVGEVGEVGVEGDS